MSEAVLLKRIVSLADPFTTFATLDHEIVSRHVAIFLPQRCNLAIFRVNVSCVGQTEITSSVSKVAIVLFIN